MNTPNILIVDDDKETRGSLKGFLKSSLVCNVFEAENGEEALKNLTENPCDIMILDIRMPKKSGIRVLDEMEKIAKGVDIIVVTAWDSDLVAEECAKRNAECIPKPMDLDEFYNKVAKLLKKRDKFIPVRGA